MTKVVPIPRYKVRYNKRSILTSFLLSLNVASMPLKAYISEPFPWIPDERVDWNEECAAINQTQCMEKILEKAKFYSTSLAPGSSYDYGIAYDLVRQQVTLEKNSLYKMPSAQSYSKLARSKALDLGAGKMNASDFSAVIISKYWGFPIAYSSTWAMNSSTSSQLEVYAVLQFKKLPFAFNFFKFAFRVALSICLVHAMYRYYYQHYLRLARNLSIYGFDDHTGEFTIVIGDPTSIIVPNPLISLCFFLDFIMSLDYFTRAIFRIYQTDNIIVFFLATLYFSRSLWFVYCGLNIISTLIKITGGIRFRPIDPSMVAFFVAIFSGPVTYLQSRWSVTIDFYYFIFTQILAVDDNTIEVAIAGILYILTILFLPVVYGLIVPYSCHREPIPFELKNRLLLGISMFSFQTHRLNLHHNVQLGGSVYPLFHINPRLRSHKTMSQIGSDALITFKSQFGDKCTVRLTLVQCLNMPVFAAKLPLAVGYIDPLSFTIHQGAHASPWFVSLLYLTMNRVVPSPGPGLHLVRYNKRSLFTTFLLSVNVAIMPLKAYLTEPFPWLPEVRTDWNSLCDKTNHTYCKDAVLAKAKSYSLLLEPSEYVKFTPAYDVSKHSVLLNNSQEGATFLLDMPYAQYYSKETRAKALALGAGTINFTDFQSVSLSLNYGSPFTYTSIWAVNGSTPNQVEVYVVYQLSSLPHAFNVFKLVFRIILSILIIYYMYRDYYRHYFHLRRNLVCYGLNGHKGIYRIVVGDPTSIILLNPLFAFSFFLDFSMSYDFFCRSVVRVCQVEDKLIFFLSALYLSRSLWFAYSGLTLTSLIVKRLPGVRFHPIDPSMIALFVALFSGPITYFQSRSLFVIEFYYILLNNAINIPDDCVEIGVAGLLYMLTIVILPINYGLIAPLTCYRRHTPTEVKSRLLMNINLYSFHANHRLSEIHLGGTIYPLFLHNQLLRRHLGMSQMGADALVTYRRSDGARVRVRLTLISCVDMPLKQAKTLISVGYIDHLKCKIYQGSHGSPWIQ